MSWIDSFLCKVNDPQIEPIALAISAIHILIAMASILL